VSAISYKNVGKPHNAADAQHVNFPKFGGRDAHMVADIGGVRQGVRVATGSLYKAERYLLRFCGSFEVKCWFPQFEGTGAPIGVGLRCVRWGVSDFLQIALQSLGVCYGFAAVFNLIF